MIKRPTNPKVMLVRSAGFPQDWVDEMKATIPDANFTVADDNETSIFAAAPDVNAIIGCPRHIFTAKLLEVVQDSLCWVHGSGAGVDTFMFEEFINSDFLFTNGRIIQGPEVADHALALLLAMTRNIHGMLQGKAYKEMNRAIELRKKTALIYGLGGIGLCIAERVKGFGMYCIGLANDMPPMVSIMDEFYPHETLMEHIGKADVVFCAAPSTKESNYTFGYEQFAAMKPDAFFINVSRGKLVDTDGLVKALEEGMFRGVGLDVADPDFIGPPDAPRLPEDHYLRHCERVLATPHMAGPSDHNRRRSFELIQLNIRRFIAGKTLFNPVDKSQGY